jgi:hypothetical protein
MASTSVRRRISAQVSVTRRCPSNRAIGKGGVEAELISPAPIAVQEVGIDKGREYRIKLGRFQSPQSAGLFRGDAKMRRLLELLANKLDPITNPAGAVGLSRGGD